MDERYMRRAIELAKKARGRTSPNPLVGAVVVNNGRIIGEGYHKQAGGLHAEVFALNASGKNSKDATLYVTLEPCCVYGRTPPCTETIKKSEVSRVVIGMKDLNPKVSGRGVKELKKSGITLKVGILEEEIAKQNESYIKYITTGKPFVLLKVAMSLDGKVSESLGKRTQISGEESWQEVHRLRDKYDAVLTGIGTVLSDNPLLTARLNEGKNPLRIIVDTKARLPLNSQIAETATRVPTLLATSNKASREKIRELEECGIEAVILQQKNERIDLTKLLKKLAEREITSVLVEGGPRLNSAMLNEGLVDKFLFIISPQLIVKEDAPSLVNGELKGKFNFKIADVKKVGEDILVEAYPL